MYLPDCSGFHPKENARPVNAKTILAGVILGDIAGQPYEFSSIRYDSSQRALFDKQNHFTDDTVMCLATAYAIKNQISFEESYRFFGQKYPDAGYGAGFYNWLFDEEQGPYNSCGNGSAMRVHAAGIYSNDVEEVIRTAIASAEVTHNHPEGIKGAVVVAVCVWMIRNGATKEDILNYVSMFYPEESCPDHVRMPLEKMKQNEIYIRQAVLCQGTIPLAVRCFYESSSCEDCLQKVLNMYCDTDTVAAIAGGFAAGYYGLDEWYMDHWLKLFLDDFLYYEVWSNC